MVCVVEKIITHNTVYQHITKYNLKINKEMKKILSILAVLLLIGCSTDEQANCSCIKNVYDLEDTIIIVNGIPTFGENRYVFKYSEEVICQEETGQYVPIGNNQAFRIFCE